MPEIKFYNREPVPMEMHKVKIVQKLTLLPARERLAKLQEAGFDANLIVVNARTMRKDDFTLPGNKANKKK